MDITDEDMLGAVLTAIREVAALSLGAHYPTLAAVPHVVIDGYKNVLAIALGTDYTFPLAQKASRRAWARAREGQGETRVAAAVSFASAPCPGPGSE
jgi:large subunit ribosomal protein LP0